jgi:hypothetical protein
MRHRDASRHASSLADLRPHVRPRLGLLLPSLLTCGAIAACAGLAASSIAIAALDPDPRPASAPSSAPADPSAESDRKPAPAPATDNAAEAQPDDPEPEPDGDDAAAKPRDSSLSEARLLFSDGSSVSGLLVSRSDKQVVLRIHNIDTPFPIERVENIEILPSVEVRYLEMRSAIDPKDVERLMLVARWLFDRQRYALALKELDGILKISPNEPAALELKLLAEQTAKLAARAGRVKKDGPLKPAVDEARPSFPLLNRDQINRIKVFEVDLADPPRLTIRRDTIERLIRKYTGTPPMPETAEGRTALFRKPAHEVLSLIFALRAREFYGEVEVEDHPRTMKAFRDRVHGVWLSNSCATSKCHGGEQAGRLQLSSGRRFADPVFYTNFLILDRFRLNDGKPLINYEDPASSPLLEMGLPAATSNRPHPPIPPEMGQFKPVFRSRDDNRYREALDWIKSVYRPRPDYGITYTPPGPSEPPKKPVAGPDEDATKNQPR